MKAFDAMDLRKGVSIKNSTELFKRSCPAVEFPVFTDKEHSLVEISWHSGESGCYFASSN